MIAKKNQHCDHVVESRCMPLISSASAGWHWTSDEAEAEIRLTSGEGIHDSVAIVK